MAVTPSTMLELGTSAPDFHLADTVSGKVMSLADFHNAPVLVVAFMCNHCPYVKHLRKDLAEFGHDVQAKGAAMVGISSNDVTTHPQDGPENMTQEAQDAGYTFPYLYDETQDVAKAYRAACTPDFYVFDGERKLVYRGQFDDSRPGNKLPITGLDLRNAVDAVLEGRAVSPEQKPSMGCNIKWTAGREPDYFG